jgi:hypothetical protein
MMVTEKDIFRWNKKKCLNKECGLLLKKHISYLKVKSSKFIQIFFLIFIKLNNN